MLLSQLVPLLQLHQKLLLAVNGLIYFSICFITYFQQPPPMSIPTLRLLLPGPENPSQ